MQSLVGKYSKTCFNGFQRFLLFSTSTSTDSFANYLVKSLGFSHQQALKTSAKLPQRKNKVIEFKFNENANSVVNFFKFHGFNDTHIKKIVSLEPRLLNSNVDKSIEPKFKFLQDQGFSGSDIIAVVAKNPRILVFGLKSYALPAIRTLRRFLGCDHHVIEVTKKSHSRAFSAIVSCLPPNVASLNSYGMPIELIRKHLLMHPSLFFRTPEAFKDILVRIEEKLGIPRKSRMFMYGIQLAGTREENFESKCQMFKSFGWTNSDIKTFIMKSPSCLSFSPETFKKKLNFLMTELQLKPPYLVTHNALLTCSIEKRILPRHKVLLILKEKGLVTNLCLFSAVKMSELCFRERFVLPYKEVHEVYAKNTACSMRMLT